LEVLALEKAIKARSLVEEPRRQHGRAMNQRSNPDRCVSNVGNIQNLVPCLLVHDVLQRLAAIIAAEVLNEKPHGILHPTLDMIRRMWG
jgi:hypothetical protein